MKKNGFTLIELISVVILLALIITLSVNVIINIINNSNNEVNDASMRLIETATKEYMTKYENDFDITNGSTYCIGIQDLINENLLISNISYDGKSINDKVVKIKYNNGYTYELDEKDSCSLNENSK
ncbi:MAG: type II secretion system GspH family protein [Clostridium sp.]|nr:type II secretion system GspH family protein [Clostridium sp.]MCM1443973.1 type II secretion system GspH family protein [Candidatus Amulumruptor caecigallinarius]